MNHPLTKKYLETKTVYETYSRKLSHYINNDLDVPEELDDEFYAVYETYYAACEKLANYAIHLALENGLPREYVSTLKYWNLATEDEQARLFDCYLKLIEVS